MVKRILNRLPKILDKSKICIICEGDEEYDYLDKLISLHVWNEKYEFYLKNAGGNGNIPARYQDAYQNASYDVVLIFCDTEKKPYEQYTDIKRKINEFHGINIAGEIIIFANPCTLQIIIEHWMDVKLSTPAKKINADLIYECTKISHYKGRRDQRKQMLECVDKENYKMMCERIAEFSTDDTIVGSSNFEKFLNCFSSDDDNWISQLNHRLENC